MTKEKAAETPKGNSYGYSCPLDEAAVLAHTGYTQRQRSELADQMTRVRQFYPQTWLRQALGLR